MPTIYAVASVKGGVGKTTTAANLAATLAAAGYDTVAVDADLGSASLGPSLGVDPDGVTLHDVLAGEADPQEALREGPHGLAVLPGGGTLEHFRKADPGEIVDVLEAITAADYVIVDTGAGLTHQTALPLSVADGVLLVSTPTRDGLANTRKTQDLTEKLGGAVVGIALNEADGDEDTGDVDVPVLGAIPDDPLVARSQAEGVPLSALAPDSDAAAAYRSLASSLTGEPIRAAPTPEHSEATPDDPEYAAAADAGPDEATVDDVDADADSDAAVDGEADTDGEADADDLDEVADPDDNADSSDDDVAAAVGADGEDGDGEEEADEEAADGDVPTEDAAADPETDDAVILDDDDADDGSEDEAAAAARSTVLEGDEYDEYRGDAPTVEDAESGESAEIGEDVIPFAQQSKERTEEAKRKQSSEDDDGDGDGDADEGGFLGRLFR
ncbi:P-loop NTPase [Halobaculum marinum]|uniref:P-loop NTPase n=1 Tax=Halobaculum marinum TaxID=3031996 RepID=A0ABD5WWU7_9EURY|nr:P-loop NTPase [Halobaculum sp. DT55]